MAKEWVREPHGHMGVQGMRCPHCNGTLYATLVEHAKYPFGSGWGHLKGYPLAVSTSNRKLLKAEVKCVECSNCESIWASTRALEQTRLEVDRERAAQKRSSWF